MKVLQNYDLKSMNTFGVAAQARYFVAVNAVAEIRQAFDYARDLNINILCLGSGSNVLFIKDFDGLVVRNRISGLQVLSENATSVQIRVGAGMVWHQLVLESLRRGWSGLENLALIPGTVGAAPIQNIGAYGVEIAERILSVEVLDMVTGQDQTLTKAECQFGYRTSVFKSLGQNRWIVTSVLLNLSKMFTPRTRYGAIDEELNKMNVPVPTPEAVAEAVMRIRRSKLPDPAELGNAGSFFKNPLIPTEQFSSLQAQFPGMVGYPDREGYHKVAAGWLIEAAGWKGHREGPCGVHTQQALVLVNYGGATGGEILALSQKVQKAVHDKFQIVLEPEVNIIGL